MNTIFTIRISNEKATMFEAGLAGSENVHPIARIALAGSPATVLVYEIVEPSDFYVLMHNSIRSELIQSYEVRIKGELIEQKEGV